MCFDAPLGIGKLSLTQKMFYTPLPRLFISIFIKFHSFNEEKIAQNEIYDVSHVATEQFQLNENRE